MSVCFAPHFPEASGGISDPPRAALDFVIFPRSSAIIRRTGDLDTSAALLIVHRVARVYQSFVRFFLVRSLCLSYFGGERYIYSVSNARSAVGVQVERTSCVRYFTSRAGGVTSAVREYSFDGQRERNSPYSTEACSNITIFMQYSQTAQISKGCFNDIQTFYVLRMSIGHS